MADWYKTNDDRLRQGSNVLVIVVTNAADRPNTVNPSSATPGGLLERADTVDRAPRASAFGQTDRDFTFALIGPDFDRNAAEEQYSEACIEPAEAPNEPSVLRIIRLAEAMGGVQLRLTDGDGSTINDPACSISDISERLQDIGDFLRSGRAG